MSQVGKYAIFAINVINHINPLVYHVRELTCCLRNLARAF